ncbi:hypothetical protein LIP_2062 [Limnochorda pilosa]|uniref:Uncharacterized protein n=1 Tax=Limnochorda pilosa TaxID=1555112 RepID=A0A0K2SLA9_LIMPI|nr:hypothetical protein LIP_2062 [Limnochorda pilosa]
MGLVAKPRSELHRIAGRSSCMRVHNEPAGDGTGVSGYNDVQEKNRMSDSRLRRFRAGVGFDPGMTRGYLRTSAQLAVLVRSHA